MVAVGDRVADVRVTIRYAAILDDGVITTLLVEPGPGVDVSSANDVIDAL